MNLIRLDMKTRFYCIIVCIVLLSCGHTEKCEDSIPDIIFETDMGNDVDDAMALDLLYKYMDAGKINLLGIAINKEGTAPAEFVDVMGTWYGYPDIPVGIIRGGADCETDAINYAKAVVGLKGEDGSPLFARSRGDYENYPEAHRLYRKILSGMPDNSVTIVSVGFSTNLKRLLETGADEYSSLTGEELVAQKVKLLCTMAGCMNNKELCEYNVVKDIDAARKVFSEWPTPVVTSPFEVGMMIEYPAGSIENDFLWAEHHPMVEAYRSYLPMPFNRPTWDLTAVLYCVENSPEFFTESPKGVIEVADNGSTIFTETPDGNRSYLITDDVQAANIRKYFVSELTKIPKNRR